MANDGVDQEVRRFISEQIGSAEQLELLLVLHGHPDERFTAAELSQRVFTVPAAALLRLEELVAQGMAASDGAADPRYRYAAATPELARSVDALAAAYRATRVGVVRTIYETPRDPLKSFADAFRLRKGE